MRKLLIIPALAGIVLVSGCAAEKIAESLSTKNTSGNGTVIESHIGIDPDNKELNGQMQVIKDYRDDRNRKLLWYFQEKGYDIKLLYFWLQSPELALKRVAERVKNGGHNVEEAVVRRRYVTGIRNLFKLYCPVVDYFILIDNSVMPREVIAEGNYDAVKVYNEEKFKMIRQYDNSKSECQEK